MLSSLFLMNNNDKKKSEMADDFGPDGKSYIGQFMRGESEIPDSSAPPTERPIFWETMSIHSDGKIVNCVNGQYMHEFPLDISNYSEILSKVKERFPDIAEGKISTLCRYRDGRTTIETKDPLKGLRT